MAELVDRIQEYATQAVEYVRRAVGLPLEYDSDTLPLLDHYLRSVPTEEPAAVKLVVMTAGAYFGEVVRRTIGGRWEYTDEAVEEWRVVMPAGLSFSPPGFVAAAIARAALEDFDTELDAPPRMMPYVQAALANMGAATEEEYYSLCGRLDTLEHVHEILVGAAASMLGDAGPPDGDGDADADPPDDEVVMEADPDVAGDDPGGGLVN